MKHISVEVVDHVATITLRRPEQLNAFTDTMEAEVIAALGRCDEDDGVRAIILTGSGHAFCVGADLAERGATFEDWRSSNTAPHGTQFRLEGEELPLRRDGGGRVALRIFDSTKPVIAAINGDAVGVGITMTLPADYRIATREARFGFVFSRRGLVPESCSTWFLPRIVPMPVALDWVLSGRVFTAQEALAKGLVSSLHPREQLLGAAQAIACEVVAHTAPVSIALARRMMWRMSGAAHPMRAHEIETLALNSRGVSDDAQEGISAFLEKREALFSDRVSTDMPYLPSDEHDGYRRSESMAAPGVPEPEEEL